MICGINSTEYQRLAGGNYPKYTMSLFIVNCTLLINPASKILQYMLADLRGIDSNASR